MFIVFRNRGSIRWHILKFLGERSFIGPEVMISVIGWRTYVQTETFKMLYIRMKSHKYLKFPIQDKMSIL